MRQHLLTIEALSALRSNLFELNIYCHPENYELLKSQLETIASDEGVHLIRGAGARIFTDEYIEKRKIKQVWHPPRGDRFVEYEYSDEDWMRPLGLGKIENVDEGPLFLILDNSKRMPWLGISCRFDDTMLSYTQKTLGGRV